MANYTILLVDYEPRSIERARVPLEQAGYVVRVASDGLTALKAFQEIEPNLVLIEAMIPKKHGFEVCQEIKRSPEGKRTPVIITTGVYKGRKYRSQALHIYHCDEYVEKPISEEQLLGVVRRFLGEPPASAGESDPFAAGIVPLEDDAPVIEILDDESDAPARPEEAPAARESAPPAAPANAPRSSDPAEREILDRLDAILPGGGGGGGSRAALATAVDPIAALPGAEAVAAPDEMDVGAISVQETEIASPQVVSLDDARRARKAKRKKTGEPGRGVVSVTAPPPKPETPAPSATDSRQFEPVPEDAGPKGLPGWVWGVAFVGTLIAFYFLVFTG